MAERLMRSSQNKIIGGVCGGLGDYFDIDPVFVRIIAVILAFTGYGVLAYIVAWIIMPVREFDPTTVESTDQNVTTTTTRSSWGRYLPGLILIIIGSFLLARQFGIGFDWGEFWAVVFIGAGIYYIFRRKEKARKSNNYNISDNQPKSENGGSVR